MVGRFQPCPPHFWPPLHSSVQPGRVSSPPPPRRRPGYGAREDWPAKVSCAVGPASRPSKRAPAPRPALPAPPRPAASEPPRPWPGARASSAAQMPRRSRRVGTCPGAGAWAATASPLCQPSSRFSGAFAHSSLGRSGRAAAPRAGPPARLAQQEARGPWFPGRRCRGSRPAAGRCSPCPRPAPCTASGGRRGGVGGGAGRAAASGGGRRASAEPHTPAPLGEKPRSEPRASPARPIPGPRAGARGCALRCAARKRKLLAGPLARATSLRAARGGAARGAPGDGERTRRVGSGAQHGASPAINSSVRGREDGASALRAPGLLGALTGPGPCPRPSGREGVEGCGGRGVARAGGAGEELLAGLPLPPSPRT